MVVPLDETHLDEVRGLSKRFRPVRKQGELVGATQLHSSRTNRSSVCANTKDSIQIGRI